MFLQFLVSIGRDADAVAVVHRIAKVNGLTSSLTVEALHQAAVPYFKNKHDGAQVTTKFSTLELLKLSFKDMSGAHFKGLFATPRLAYSTSLIVVICKLVFHRLDPRKLLAHYFSLADAALGVR